MSCDGMDGCSGNGECVDVNTCQCYTGYQGSSCDKIVECPSVHNCSQNGVCVDKSTCLCFVGYFDDTCDQFECEHGCSGRGTCVAPDFCSCTVGWTGFDCSVPPCEEVNFCSGQQVLSFLDKLLFLYCMFLSSGNGQCVGLRTCECDDIWCGPSCNIFLCNSDSTGNCSNHGECTTPDQCTCDSDFCGNDCQISGAARPFTSLFNCSEPFVYWLFVC